MPGWLTAMTSNLQAICGMTRRRSYHAGPGQPWDRQQWPSMAARKTACRRRSAVSTYLLVKVPLNPLRRFGSPETEPRPCEVDKSEKAEAICSGPRCS